VYSFCAIKKITPEGVVTTIAGKAGNHGYADGPGVSAAFSTNIGRPSVCVDSTESNLYVMDT
jgi:hypothetical protein